MGSSGGTFGVNTTAQNAAALGLQYQTIDIGLTKDAFNLGAGTMVAVLIRPGAITATNLGTWLTQAGSTTSLTNRLALYTAAGVFIAQTADMTAAFSGSTGYIQAALTASQNLAANTNYYLCALTNFGSVPKIAGANANTNLPPVLGHYPSVFITGQDTFPASFTPASATANSGLYWLTIS